jgi:hypothetical protein
MEILLSLHINSHLRKSSWICIINKISLNDFIDRIEVPVIILRNLENSILSLNLIIGQINEVCLKISRHNTNAYRTKNLFILLYRFLIEHSKVNDFVLSPGVNSQIWNIFSYIINWFTSVIVKTWILTIIDIYINALGYHRKIIALQHEAIILLEVGTNKGIPAIQRLEIIHCSLCVAEIVLSAISWWNASKLYWLNRHIKISKNLSVRYIHILLKSCAYEWIFLA